MVDSLRASQENVLRVWGDLTCGKKDILLPTAHSFSEPEVLPGCHLIYDLGLSLSQIRFILGNNPNRAIPFWEPQNYCVQNENGWMDEQFSPAYWILKGPSFGSLKWKWQKEEIDRRHGFQRASVRLVAFAVVSFALIHHVDFLRGEDHWGGHLESLKKADGPNKGKITSAVVLAYRNNSLSIYRRVIENPHDFIACCMAKEV